MYLGFVYKYDGAGWRQASEAKKYNPKTQAMEPLSEDQYDPLGLLSTDEKSKRALTKEQINRVADQFGVTHKQAWQDAHAQGYAVPSESN